MDHILDIPLEDPIVTDFVPPRLTEIPHDDIDSNSRHRIPCVILSSLVVELEPSLAFPSRLG